MQTTYFSLANLYSPLQKFLSLASNKSEDSKTTHSVLSLPFYPHSPQLSNAAWLEKHDAMLTDLGWGRKNGTLVKFLKNKNVTFMLALLASFVMYGLCSGKVP